MKKILYVFDNINYMSGAQKVTLYQIQQLKAKHHISVFSFNKPAQHMISEDVKVLGEDIWPIYEYLGMSLKNVLKDNKISFIQKCCRIKYTLLSRVKKEEKYLNKLLGNKLKNQFEDFDVVIVVSEASKLRKIVSELKNPQKIQWVHTDYARWCEFSSWTRDITKNDIYLYEKFDKIILLSEYSKEKMIKILPHLKDKMEVIPNLILGDDILKKANEIQSIKLNNSYINIITVGRLEKEKNHDRIIDICKKLKNDCIEYKWYFVGDGSLRRYLEFRIKSENLDDRVTLLGNLDNPISIMRECDWFVLLSEYEGTPVTIDEAKVIGLPVIALECGGIKEQLHDLYGYLLKDDAELYQRFLEIILGKKGLQFEFNYLVVNNEIEKKIDKILEGSM